MSHLSVGLRPALTAAESKTRISMARGRHVTIMAEPHCAVIKQIYNKPQTSPA